MLPTAPYHRLARTDRYRWWKPLLELVLVGVLWFAFAIAAMTGFAMLGIVDAEQLDQADGAVGVIILGVTLAVLLPAALLAARAVGRSPRSLLSAWRRLRWGWLATCAGVALLLFGVAFAINLVVDPAATRDMRWPGWDKFAPLAAAVLLVIPFQAAGEEFVFRGSLMQAIGAWIAPPWVVIVVTAAIFSLVHGLGPEGSIAIAMMGLVAAWLTVRTGGLEAALGLHVVNNVVAFLLIAASGGGDTWIRTLNTQINWTMVAIDSAVQLGYGAIIAWLYGRRVSSGSAASLPGSASAASA
jgi:membrane protease YdiL (CAAX protease family)